LTNNKQEISKSSRKKIAELLKIRNIPEELQEIKKLPIIALKDIDMQMNHIILTILDVITLDDLARKKITADHKKEFRKHGIAATSLDKWVAASKVICNIEKLEEKPTKKIIFMGLDNAGKTSIIKLLTQSYGMEAFSDLTPTEGVERHEVVGPASGYVIWDFGGQELYRRVYLDDPERYLIGIDLFFFVIDIQDKDRFHEAYNYFEKIIEVLRFLKESPEINILIHKFDPELENNPEAYELLNQVQLIFKDILKDLNCEFYTTSIFNSLPTGEKLIGDIKGFLKGGLKKRQKDIENYQELLDIMEKMMDIFFKFSVNIEENQSRIVERLEKLEQIIAPGEEIKKLKQTPPMPAEELKTELLVNKGDTKSRINKELKSLFEKKMSKIS
jgi:GTPase SAR1 family protein